MWCSASNQLTSCPARRAAVATMAAPRGYTGSGSFALEPLMTRTRMGYRVSDSMVVSFCRSTLPDEVSGISSSTRTVPGTL